MMENRLYIGAPLGALKHTAVMHQYASKIIYGLDGYMGTHK